MVIWIKTPFVEMVWHEIISEAFVTVAKGKKLQSILIDPPYRKTLNLGLFNWLVCTIIQINKTVLKK